MIRYVSKYTRDVDGNNPTMHSRSISRGMNAAGGYNPTMHRVNLFLRTILLKELQQIDFKIRQLRSVTLSVVVGAI
jgi:hypothetical protein